MSTSPLAAITTPKPSLLPKPSATGTSASTNAYNSLKPQDFISMMITQLQNQDPTQPVSNSDLLNQMSQIGQLQSSTQLQSSLTTMVLQNQIGSAGNLIGKSVQGLSDTNQSVSGSVTSVRVQNNQVYLRLDSGSDVQLSQVTSVAPTPTPAATTTTAATTTAATTATPAA